MCLLCDDPNRTIEKVLEQILARIARDRFATVGVHGSRCTAEFTYTVGLTEHGLPELIVTGQRPELANRLVRLWGDYLLDESLVLPGEWLHAEPFVLEAVQVKEPQQHLRVAHRFYGDQLRALQLVWADPDGRWPWDPGFRARSAGQPLLGDRGPFWCEEHAPRLDIPPHL